MIRTINPKNARAKRALDKKEPKLVENVKQALFIPGQTSNKFLHEAMIDLSGFKKPNIKRFSHRNDVRPFEDVEPIEFYSEKNDCSLVVVSSNSKKRKNNLTFIRTFGYKVYDMIELQICENYKLLSDFKKQTVGVGLKPIFSFQGEAFESHPVYKHVKSLFLDFFRGESSSLQDVAGLQYVISLTVEGDFKEGESLPNVLFRVYKLKTFRSSQGGKKLPRVELEEIGPRFDFKIGRIHTPSPEMVKDAHKKAKQLEFKTAKNVEIDGMGDKIGRIHVGKQDLNQLQTRKMKGLKAKYDQVDSETEAYINEDEHHLNDDSYGEDYVTASEIEPPSKKHKK
ncbi:rRNA-binding ribosome biosynthesis protein RPF2 Ecym_4046 [Eremothecium cymbalariae DBVPG|uniref:Ribosome production factor 2 homolog n=1 Tax=Eremothecium cymbalariae (strain CBS 270.75 / DBVPG 7215 / KCTC 17166 / NRRL Y-17582) TaxID=931890 RepID=G8JSX4_ERECY|nr:hypothetical protein Ecym_4046 [Eremothecium cymbalariae DBVPG\